MNTYFNKSSIQVIEMALSSQKKLEWERLPANEFISQKQNNIHAGWLIKIPEINIFSKSISHVYLLIDEKFPNSQPLIIAPQLIGGYIWPHIDNDGLFCLRSTQVASDPGQRILQHLMWADELLNYNEAECRQEFCREFSTYWSRCSYSKETCPKVFSLLKTKGKSRSIVYYENRHKNQIVIADDEENLRGWLVNRGINPRVQDILVSWLSVLFYPWIPSEYPNIGSDVLKYVPSENLHELIISTHRLPLFFEARTSLGSVIVGVVLKGIKKKELLRGFRHINQVPLKHIMDSFGRNTIQRCVVTRVDGVWINGRDRDDDFTKMYSKKIAIVGCGSLGSMLARLLAQSGIGSFIFIDGDYLESANISRHALGIGYIGKNKAFATEEMLKEDFPHIKGAISYPKHFERLSSQELKSIENVDLIISAGIDFDGDINIDTWRLNLSMPPAHLCAWVEAFATVGHAVLLYGKDSLLSGFDESEKPTFRVSDWPEENSVLAIEAGCGNAFQSHGFVDLQPTITLAAKLVIDLFMDKIPSSCRRIWQGDIKSIKENGGILRHDTIESFVVREIPWQ